MSKPYKNANGIWCVRFTMQKNKFGHTKRIHIQCKPELNNLAALKEQQKNAIERWVSGKFTTSDTFESYVKERFLQEYPAAKNLEPASLRNLTYNLLHYAVPLIGSVPLAALDAGAVGRFIAKLKVTPTAKKERLSDRSIRHCVVAVLCVLRWAAKLGDIGQCPDVDLPKVVAYLKPKPYEAHEVRALVEATDCPRDRAMVLLVYDAGLRISEMLGLTWPQVDFAKHRLIIDRQCYQRVVKHTKSGRERLVPMTPELEAALKEIRSPTPFVIMRQHPDNLGGITAHAARQLFYRLQKRAGLRRTRVHDGRHHIVSRLTDGGMSLFAVRDLLGHRDIRTTQIYAHPSLPSVLPSAMDTNQKQLAGDK